MQALYDFFPIIVFGIFYYFWGIYAATASIIVTSTIQVIYHSLRFKKFEIIQVVTMILVWVLGGATLALHNIMFIKWKPSVIYFLFACVLIGCELFSNHSPIKNCLAKRSVYPIMYGKSLALFGRCFLS